MVVTSSEMFTILASDNYNAVPITVTETTAVKAGTPLTSAGKKTTSGVTGAAGILLYDVDPTVNPVGTLLVQGVVDGTKAKANSGVDISTIGTVVPGIVVRSNVGVNA